MFVLDYLGIDSTSKDTPNTDSTSKNNLGTDNTSKVKVNLLKPFITPPHIDHIIQMLETLLPRSFQLELELSGIWGKYKDDLPRVSELKLKLKESKLDGVDDTDSQKTLKEIEGRIATIRDYRQELIDMYRIIQSCNIYLKRTTLTVRPLFLEAYETILKSETKEEQYPALKDGYLSIQRIFEKYITICEECDQAELRVCKMFARYEMPGDSDLEKALGTCGAYYLNMPSTNPK